MQPRDPTDVALTAAAGTVAQGADAEIKPSAGLIVSLQKVLDAVGFARRQTADGAVRPQCGEKYCPFGRALEERGQAFNGGVYVQHWTVPRGRGRRHAMARRPLAGRGVALKGGTPRAA